MDSAGRDERGEGGPFAGAVVIAVDLHPGVGVGERERGVRLGAVQPDSTVTMQDKMFQVPIGRLPVTIVARGQAVCECLQPIENLLKGLGRYIRPLL